MRARICSLLVFLFAWSVSVSAAEIVELEPFRVIHPWFTLVARYNSEGRVRRVDLVEVIRSTPAGRAGLHEGDVLHAIGDRPVQGLKREEFEELQTWSGAADEVKVYTFVIERGLLKKERKLLQLAVVLRPKKGTEKSP